MRKLIFIGLVLLFNGCAMMNEISANLSQKTIMSGQGQIGKGKVVSTIVRDDANTNDVRKYNIKEPTGLSLNIYNRTKDVLSYQGYIIVKKSGEKIRVDSDGEHIQFVKNWRDVMFGIPNNPLLNLIENNQVSAVILVFKEGELTLKPKK